MRPYLPSQDLHSRKNHKKGKNYVKHWVNTHLNNILMLYDCIYERLALEVVLRYESCKLIKLSSFGYKVSLWCFLMENCSLDELRHQGFIAFLVVDWVCYSFETVRGVAPGEDYRLKFCLETCLEVWHRK